MKMTMEEATRRMAQDREGALIVHTWENITALPDGLQVGGGLNLRGTNITALPSGLVVAGDLNICCTRISSLPNDLTIGGEIYADNHALATPPRVLREGDYVEGKYIFVDGILTSIKKTRKVQGYTLYVGRMPDENVVSDGKNYAHCKTLRDGIADLMFKVAADRGADQYRHLTLDSELTAEEIITMYRIITGACRQGTARFVASLGELKEKYTIREAVEITKGQYNAESFKRFFEA